MGPLGELGALFNPGMRHEMEERRAKQMLREEEGTGRKGRLRIDLESGVAVIQSGTSVAPADGDPAAEDVVDDATNGAAGRARDEEGSGPQGKPAGHGAEDSVDGDADRCAGARPGEPRPANRSASPVPSGKARRQANGMAPSLAPSPAGRSRRAR